MGSRVRRLTPVAALAAYCALAAALFWAPLTSGGRYWVGVPRDAELFMWYLRWVPFAVLHGHDPLLTSYIHNPGVVNAMWNTSIVFPSLVMTPATWALGPIAAYNILMAAAVALSAWCAYLAAMRFVKSHLAGAVAGLLYGFSPYMVSQGIGHVHLTVALFPPLVLLAAHELFVRRRLAPALLGALVGIAAVAQLLTSEEVLATSAVVALAAAVLAAVTWPQAVDAKLVRRFLVFAVTAVVVFAVLAAFPLKVQFLGPERVTGLLQSSNTYVTSLVGFVVPTLLQRFTTPGAIAMTSTVSGNGSENNAYLGIPLILVVVLAAAVLRSRPVIWALLCAGAAALLSMGPRLHVTGPSTDIRLPWVLVEHLPLFENVLPSRIMLFAFLFLGLVLALLLDAALRWRSGLLRVAGVVAVIAALAPLLPLTPYPDSSGPDPAFFASSQAHNLNGEVVLVTPVTGAAAMRWQAEAGMTFRQTAGTAFIPGPIFGPPPSPLLDALGQIEAGRPAPVLDSAERQALLADLQRLHPTLIVVGPTVGAGPLGKADASVEAVELDFLQNLLGKTATPAGGVYLLS